MTQKLSKMHLVSSKSFDFFQLFGFSNSMRHIFMSKNGPVAYVEIALFAANRKKCIIFVDCSIFFMYCEYTSQNQLAKDGN